MSDTDADGLFADHKADLPTETHDAFDAMVGRGCSPRSAAAAIEYVVTEKTQAECAAAYDTSETTVSVHYPAVAARLPDEVVVCDRHGRPTAAELARAVADALDWEEGTHYSLTHHVSYSGAHQVNTNLKRAGWRDLHQRHVATEADGDE